ncbi:MAG TPA: hypothetical protein VF502_07060 [Stellaceae bacterium]
MPERNALPDRQTTPERPVVSEAQRLRDHAVMLRQLAEDAAAPSIASQLLAVAEDFEKQAVLLEEQG